MGEHRTIEIDFDIHKLIEAERRGFDEAPNETLRRLLKLGAAVGPAISPKPAPKGRPWSGDGVVLAHGTKLRMSYNGRTYEGQILDGKWVVEGKTFSSPSGAASGTATTKKGTKTRLDGWIYWEVKPAGADGWTRLDSLTPKTVTTTASSGELGF